MNENDKEATTTRKGTTVKEVEDTFVVEPCRTKKIYCCWPLDDNFIKSFEKCCLLASYF